MPTYNYDNFSANNYDFDNSAGPAVGQKAPDFQLEKIDGTKQQLLDFKSEFLVLELGSVTCPLFNTRREGMEVLQTGFPDFDYAVLYVREAHPGANIPAHKSFADKKACATRLRTEDRDSRSILIDGLDGAAHQAYGSMPNAIYIIDKEHVVRFKSDWNNPSATHKALRQIIAGKEVSTKSYFQPAKPSVVLNTVNRAGKGSSSDFFISLPGLIWKNLIKRNLKILFRKT